MVEFAHLGPGLLILGTATGNGPWWLPAFLAASRACVVVTAEGQVVQAIRLDEIAGERLILTSPVETPRVVVDRVLPR